MTVTVAPAKVKASQLGKLLRQTRVSLPSLALLQTGGEKEHAKHSRGCLCMPMVNRCRHMRSEFGQRAQRLQHSCVRPWCLHNSQSHDTGARQLAMKLQRISIVVWKANHGECLQMNFKCCKLDVAHVFCFSSNLAKFKQTTKIAACRYGAQCCDGCQKSTTGYMATLNPFETTAAGGMVGICCDLTLFSA